MKAVVFDMDGVLFDTEVVCMKAWMAIAEKWNLPDMEEVFPRCIGLNANDSRQIVLKAYGEDFDYPAFRRQSSEWLQEYMAENGLPVKPGVLQILDWLKGAGYAVGLASSTRSSSVFRYLEQSGLKDCFSVVITGDMIEHSKPRPDIYLLACAGLNVKPQEAYAIEDSPNGIRSAHAAGMRPIMVPDMIAPDEEMRRLSFRIQKDLFEVLAYLQQEKEKEKITNLGIPGNTIEVLQKYHFNFQKKYGQNFLIDTRVLDKIIRAARITKDDCVLEIGPGIGTMTQYLAERAGEVVAVEIDRNLIPILEETLSPYANVTLINQDILKMDLKKLAQERGKALKVVANLPYYITTPIIMGLFENGVPLQSITVMVQKEVAERMQAGPGTKDYGALSLAVQYYARPEIVAYVPQNCFIPRPNVGSSVIHLTKYDIPPVRVEDERFFFAVIRASFNQRRKTLVNGLTNASELGIPRERIVRALEQMQLPGTIRGEALTLEQFAELSNFLFPHDFF